MEPEKVKYRYVDMSNPFMRQAYLYARRLYDRHEWNEKACPVVVLALDGKAIACEASGGGMHQEEEYCARFGLPKSDYSLCRWCKEDEHAEQRALRWLKVNPAGADLYLYGHYRMCDACVKAMHKAGIYDFYLLDGADALFNHHAPTSIIGKPEQFEL